MSEADDVESRLAALEEEVAQERTEAELRAMEALRAEERELQALTARLAALHRAHRDAVSEVLGGYAEEPSTTPRAGSGAGGPAVGLPVDLYARLDQLAGERGQSVEALCVEVLDGYMRSRKRPPAEAGEA